MHWTLCALIIGSFGCKYILAQAQRVPPGVPPQHYQQVTLAFPSNIVEHMVQPSASDIEVISETKPVQFRQVRFPTL